MPRPTVPALIAAALLVAGCPDNPPIIIGPVGDSFNQSIWVSNVAPGDVVEVADVVTGSILGSATATESIVRVPITATTNPVEAREGGDDSTWVLPLSWPGLHGAEVYYEIPFDFGTVDIDGMTYPLHGQSWWDPFAPIGGGPPPVAVLMHGAIITTCQMNDENGAPFISFPGTDPTHLGFRYLGEQLASRGFAVFSLDLATDLLPPERAEFIMAALDAIRNNTNLDEAPVGLVGHSLGGEAVIIAADLNDARDAVPQVIVNDDGTVTVIPEEHDIQAVVSIAPVAYHMQTPKVPYLQITGSHDYFFQSTDPQFLETVHHVDRAERPKGHLWVHGGTHEQFNSCYAQRLDPLTVELSDQSHENLAQAYIGAMFEGHLNSQPLYLDFIRGPVIPYGVSTLPAFLDHIGTTASTVIDNFGDDDPEMGITADADDTLNSLGGAVTIVGAGGNNAAYEGAVGGLHLTGRLGLHLEWDSPGLEYRTDLSAAPPAANVRDFLCIRVAQDETSALNPVDTGQDFSVELHDGVNSARVRFGMAGALPYPDLDADGLDRLRVLRTLRMPLSAFTGLSPDLDPTALTELRIIPDVTPAGALIIDSIEICE